MSISTPSIPELTQLAIQASLTGQWKQAIDLNLHILQLETNNISALNRLAKAYEEENDLEKAKKSYRRVLGHDKYNRIALNNLDRLKIAKTGHHKKNQPLATFSFIEEPGKTKTVILTKLAPHQTLSQLMTSSPIFLKPKKRFISVNTPEGQYIGYLPDDLSLHLIRLIKLGNKYEAAVKTVTKTVVEIFIRETKRGNRLKGLPSFAVKDTQKYYQFLPTEPISEIPLEIPDSETLEVEI